MKQQPLALVGSEPDIPDGGSEVLSHEALPPGFVRAVLNDSRLTDMLMDALEARVVALEEVAAARGLRRLAAARRLRRSLRASIRHFSGDTFAERRCDAASTELGSAWPCKPCP